METTKEKSQQLGLIARDLVAEVKLRDLDDASHRVVVLVEALAIQIAKETVGDVERAYLAMQTSSAYLGRFLAVYVAKAACGKEI